MNEQAQKLRSIFVVGGKYSLYQISEMMAMTSKTEIIVREIDEERSRLIFSKPRGRKRFILPFVSRSYQSAPELPFVGAIFEGHGQAVKCDTESRTGSICVMRGNACYNFIGTVEAIRTWIENDQLNPFFDKAKVVAIDPADTSTCGDAPETVVYPELVEPGCHAVIDRLMAKTA